MQKKHLEKRSLTGSIGKPKLIILLVFLVFIPVCIYVGVFWFRISEIVIIGEDATINEKILSINNKLRENYIGRNILFVDLEDLQNDVLQNIGEYDVYSLNKLLPSKIEIKIRRISSKYYVKVSDKLYGISDKFIVSEEVNISSTVKFVNYHSSLKLGEKIVDRRLIAGLKYSEIKDALIDVNDIVTFMINSKTEVILPEDDKLSSEEIVELLKKITQKYSIENKELKTIDLRFSEPVVKFY